MATQAPDHCATADAPASPRTLLVFAHPDDETVGMGASLARLGDVWFVCVTDGAPLDLADARRAGCRTREEYARLRKNELCAAVCCAGHDPARIAFLGIRDQEASWQLAGITRAIDTFVEMLAPHRVVTQPFEGGHPDHDATAFAVHVAMRSRRARGAATPAILEMTAYHSHAGQMQFGEFLPDSGEIGISLTLRSTQRARKQRLIACHASQAHVLRAVPLAFERFRRAPDYDFTQPPHSGKLLYERFRWGIDGAGWRACAACALEQLELRETPRASREMAPCGSPS